MVDFDSVVGSIRVSFSAYENYDFEKIGEIFERNVLRFLKNVNVRK